MQLKQMYLSFYIFNYIVSQIKYLNNHVQTQNKIRVRT
jgi:hypothetical protein